MNSLSEFEVNFTVQIAEYVGEDSYPDLGREVHEDWQLADYKPQKPVREVSRSFALAQKRFFQGAGYAK